MRVLCVLQEEPGAVERLFTSRTRVAAGLVFTCKITQQAASISGRPAAGERSPPRLTSSPPPGHSAGSWGRDIPAEGHAGDMDGKS